MRGQPDHPRAGAGLVSEPSPGILGSQHYARPRGPLPPFTSALPSISRKAGQLRDGRPDYCLLNTNQYRAFSEDRPGCGPQFVAPVDGLLITADASFKRISWRKRALQSVVAAVSALQLNSPPTMAGRRSCLIARRRRPRLAVACLLHRRAMQGRGAAGRCGTGRGASGGNGPTGAGRCCHAEPCHELAPVHVPGLPPGGSVIVGPRLPRMPIRTREPPAGFTRRAAYRRAAGASPQRALAGAGVPVGLVPAPARAGQLLT